MSPASISFTAAIAADSLSWSRERTTRCVFGFWSSAMMDIVAPKLKSGVRMLSETVRANAREGDIGGPLREIAKAHPDTIIGSYPFIDEDQKPNTHLVVRSRDQDKLSAAMAAVKEMLAGLNVTR